MKNFKIENSRNIYNFGTEENVYDIRDGYYDYTGLQVDNYFTCDDIELGALSYHNGVCEISYDTPENNLWRVYADASSDLMKLLEQINDDRNDIKSITITELQDIFDEIKDESQELSNHIENLENLKIFLKNLRIAINDNYPDFNEIDINSAKNLF
jgi:hypothetical protein